MALGHASPGGTLPPTSPPPSKFSGGGGDGAWRDGGERFPSAERDLAAVRQQMFPVILLTYGIDPRSDKAALLARLLDLVPEFAPQPAPPPRIAGAVAAQPAWQPHETCLLAPPPVPFRAVPADVLSRVLSFEAVPRALILRWHDVSPQWRRALRQPLLGYYDYLRLCRASCARKGVVEPVGGPLPSPTLVPRPYMVNVAVMRCPRCDREGLVELNSDGTTWGHCYLCDTDGPFDFICDMPDALRFFPRYIRDGAGHAGGGSRASSAASTPTHARHHRPW